MKKLVLSFILDFHKYLLTKQKQSLEVFCKKKIFLKISQYSQKHTCVESSF